MSGDDPLRDAAQAHLVTATAGESTCPVCSRTWTVTPLDDCMLPACGCFGDDTTADNPHRICHSCGLGHVLRCPKREDANRA